MDELILEASKYAIERCPRKPLPDWSRYYIKSDFYYWFHHLRYEIYVKIHGLCCQDCSGAGGEKEPILDDGSGPWLDCGWFEGTGFVTRWLRGEWLRMKKRERKRGLIL